MHFSMALSLLISFTALLSAVHVTSGDVGSCSLHMYVYKTRISCEIPFFRGLQIGVIVNCSANFEALISCIKNVTRECEDSWRSDKWIDSIVRHNIRKQFYCHDGAMVLPFVLCDKGYYQRGPQCVQKFRRKFRRNVTDPTLCDAFSMAKNCIRDLLEEECSVKEHSRDLYMDIFFDGYNPFCVNQVYHPPTTAATPSTINQLPKKVTSPMASHKTVAQKTAPTTNRATPGAHLVSHFSIFATLSVISYFEGSGILLQV